MRLLSLPIVLAGMAFASLAPAASAQDIEGGQGTGGRVPGQELQPGPMPLPPAPPFAVETPVAKTLYRNGPDGRFLLDGSWLFRFDHGNGLQQGLQRSTSTSGWTPVAVPNAWNAQDQSSASFAGTTAWYRKDFRLPSNSSGAAWIVRFESVSYRSRVWLNGHAIGRNEGAFLPFELRLPSRLLSAGVNRLVIRVDNRRGRADLPPGGRSDTGKLAGGWWNYGGLLREVYLRRVDRVDFESVQVQTDLPCPTCPGAVTYRLVLRSYAGSTQRVHVVSHFGTQAVDLGTASVAAGGSRILHLRFAVANPKVWSPEHPNLYDVTFDASAGARPLAHYFLRSGIRSIKVVGGMLLLNGQALNFRGVGLHEDSPQFGFAVDNTIRERYISEVKELGATAIRAHYPLSPYLEELADANGILLWSEIPMYSLKTEYVDRPAVRAKAVDMLSRNVLTNGSHPSVIVWSIANELSSRPDVGQRAYIRDAVSTAHKLDPSRPVGLAVAAYPSVGCQAKSYLHLQVLGLNDYFGWYPGPEGQIADRDLLPEFLDKLRACYPGKGMVITEFGAEANRPGPAEERGTWDFQRDYINYQLGVFATKPWLAGALYWALEEFRVKPGWDGGDPRPDPPIHEKGLISFSGQRKPGFFEAQRLYRGTAQLRAR